VQVVNVDGDVAASVVRTGRDRVYLEMVTFDHDGRTQRPIAGRQVRLG
jgi:hypothetical protein